MEDLDTIEDEDLAELYAYPADLDRPWVRMNFVSTLDGASAGPDGRSGSINNPADMRVFGLLRALSDVVLVGGGTARAEGYRPVTARPAWQALRTAQGLVPAPTLAVVTASLDLPASLLDGATGSGPVVVLTTTGADPARLAQARAQLGDDSVLQAGDREVDLAAAVELLGERGMLRVLCEGGPRLFGDLAAAGRVDELCLTLSPRLVGGPASRIVSGSPVDVPLRLGHVVESAGVLLTRWLRD